VELRRNHAALPSLVGILESDAPARLVQEKREHALADLAPMKMVMLPTLEFQSASRRIQHTAVFYVQFGNVID
jgi:hypothetical protein